MDLANTNLPAPFFNLKQLKDSFKTVGLDRPSDLVALSGTYSVLATNFKNNKSCTH